MPLLLLLLLLLWLCRPGTSQKFVAVTCMGTDQYTAEGNYRNNLDQLLQRRYVQGGRLSFFFNTTQGDPPDMVYGLFLCRPDVPPETCRSCIDAATVTIFLACPGQKRAMIWYNECQVRFSNQSFFTVMESTPAIKIYENTNITYPDMFRAVLTALLLNVMDSSISSRESYATSHTFMHSSLEMEARAQCTPDLSKPDCRICLSVAADKLSMFSGQKQYAQIILPSCYALYEVHDSVPSAPLSKPTNRAINDESEY